MLLVCWDEKDVRFAPEPNPLAELGSGSINLRMLGPT